MRAKAKSAGIRVDEHVGEHLDAVEPPAAGERLLLQNCELERLDWRGRRVEGEVRVERCRLLGEARFDEATFAERVSLRGTTFAAGASFVKARFEHFAADGGRRGEPSLDLSEGRFEGPLSFVEATVAGDADLNEAHFRGVARFDLARFEGSTFLRQTTFLQKVTFESARFARFASFKQAAFQQECTLDGAEFATVAQFHNVRAGGRFSAVATVFSAGQEAEGRERYTVFSNSRFDDVADFTEATFGGPVRFVLCLFDQETRFPSARFQGYTSFDRARFNSVVIFQGATWAPGATLHLKDARIARIEVDHEQLGEVLHCLDAEQYAERLKERAGQLREAIRRGEQFPSDARHLEQLDRALADIDQARLEEGSRTLAVLHKAFNDSFNSKGEDWAYVALRRMERDALTRDRPVRKLLSRLLDLTCGYGTSPGKVAITAVIIVLLFTLVYLVFPGSFVGPMSFRNALTLSFRTFTSSELDSQITPQGMIEWLVMSESVLGYVVMMLLVITLSRLVIRS